MKKALQQYFLSVLSVDEGIISSVVSAPTQTRYVANRYEIDHL